MPPSTAADQLVILEALVRVEVPVLDVADANGVDVGVDGDDLVAVAHEAHDVAKAVDLYLVEAELLHLGLDAGDDLALLAGLGRVADHGAKERCHILAVVLGGLLDEVVIELLSHVCNLSVGWPFYLESLGAAPGRPQLVRKSSQ